MTRPVSQEDILLETLVERDRQNIEDALRQHAIGFLNETIDRLKVEGVIVDEVDIKPELYETIPNKGYRSCARTGKKTLTLSWWEPVKES